MYRVMLADDEGIVIDSLKFILEKEFKDDCQIRSAKTGRQVIELASDFQPDIAFMDIQMPGINGIDAMKEIKKFNTNTVFIVMTAYDKFDYAKEAIGLGVMDYLNKPVSREKIVDVVEKAMTKIDSERSKRSNDLMVREKLETVVPIIENGLIQDLLFKEYFQEDIDNYKTLLGIDADYGYMISLVFGREQEGNHMTSAVAVSIQAEKVYREIRTITEDYIKGIMGSVMSNKIPILIPCQESELSLSKRNEVVESARALCRKLSSFCDMNFRVGIGSLKPLSKMAESYEEANSALIRSTSHVAHFDDMPTGCQYEESYPVELEKELFEEIEKGHTSQALVIANSFFDWMVQAHGTLEYDIKLKAIEFVLRAEHIAYEKAGKTYEFSSRSNYLPTVLSYDNNEDLKLWFVDRIKDASLAISSKQEVANQSLIGKAIGFIDNNFTKDITLDEVSGIVNISSYYFSKVFKEETGENFIDYLTRLRIEKAKELLLSTGKSMKEIGVEVGYSDPNYFSRIFKKYTGMTPSDYSKNR